MSTPHPHKTDTRIYKVHIKTSIALRNLALYPILYTRTHVTVRVCVSETVGVCARVTVQCVRVCLMEPVDTLLTQNEPACIACTEKKHRIYIVKQPFFVSHSRGSRVESTKLSLEVKTKCQTARELPSPLLRRGRSPSTTLRTCNVTQHPRQQRLPACPTCDAKVGITIG